MYSRGNFYDPNWQGIHGVAFSDSPTGCFTAADHFVFDIETENGKIASAEDPFIWYHNTHTRFYAVFKDFSGKITEGKPGLAKLESLDGLMWTKPDNPFFMNKEVILNTGDTIKLHRFERPQLLIDENGNPEVLYCACSLTDINPSKDGASFNVHIPLKVQ